MTLRFRRAGREDVAAAQDAYRQIIEHLAATVDYPHWHSENRPTAAEVEQWAEAGELHLAVTPGADPGTERVAGVVVLNHDAPAAYQDASWTIEASAQQVLVIHVLGVSPLFLRQGVAGFLVSGALELAREQGCRAVRLDTYVDNLPARRLYAGHGFRDLGVHTLHYEGTDLSQFHLFERVL
ncbi:GNAT family N-acetyltransferase [Ornithinimicrobium ciconiae]|uniref:GNAT family N-acetyltransferase n=1 Tax=Ornithinimicrobium ciconiae TaxID=2594265 RepID=A0A516GFY7_9MICO|nr:GNAT family N-acetyltransferase [Ornithinimicrobium ciconiae]